jgi:transposase
VADCIAADVLLDHIATAEILHGDKGYDSDAVRRKIESKGAAPNIPPKVNRRWKNCFSPYLYRNRNAIERMFGRLKDFRRIATRYDRLAQNFLAAVCLAAIHGPHRETLAPALPLPLGANQKQRPKAPLKFRDQFPAFFMRDCADAG